MPSFNAVTEVAWVPVLEATNTVRRYTPYDVLTRADSLRGLADADPMYRVVTFRFLAALHLAARKNAGGLDAYLATWGDRFYLRGGRYPFLQHPDLAQTLDEEGNAPNALARIDWRRATGGTPLLWDHTSADTQLRMSAAEVILALLWSTGAGTGGPATRSRIGTTRSTATHTPNGPAASYCQALAWGTTLADTFEALAAVTEPVPGDQPVWERTDTLVLSTVPKPADPYTRIEPTGPLAWLTWPARQHLLAWDGPDATSVVAVPGWYTPETWNGRLRVDPLCPVSPRDPDKAMHATHIHSWKEVDLPPYITHLAEHGPVAIEYIAQALNKAKVQGCTTRHRQLEPQEAP